MKIQRASFRLLLVHPGAAEPRAVLESAFAWGTHVGVTCVRSAAAAEEMLAAGRLDCVLSARSLPDRDGYEWLASLRARRELSVGLVLLVAEQSEQERNEALRVGAHDCLGLDELDPRSLSRSMELAAERARSARLADQLAHYDRLASVGRATAGLTHELNNALASVLANLASARDDTREGLLSPAMLQNHLEESWEAASRVGRILRSTVHFSRFPSTRAAVHVERTVEAALQLASRRTMTSLESVVRDYRARAPAFVDEGKLCQVLVNVITNAVQALGECVAHSQALAVATEVDAQGRIVVRVTDNGPGIPRESLERIFEPFFSTKAAEDGLGLGLSLSRDLIESVGGTLDVESVFGRGATFTVRLPAHEQQAGD